MSDEKGLAGFKKSEFVTENPERVFNTADVRTEDLPDGVRLYLREKAIDLGTKKVSVNVYRIKDDGGLKNKKVWVGQMKLNRKPEDAEIAEHFGGGSFLWILKWVGSDGKESGIISEPIEIDEELGRAAHDAWKRRQVAAEAPLPVPAAAPAAPAAAPAGGLDAFTLLKLMDAAEEKSLARIERIATIFQGQKQESPAGVLESAYGKASEMMQKAVETNLSMAKSVGKRQLKEMDREDGDMGEEVPEEEEQGPGVPSWLAPFWPHIEKGLGNLLQGGPVGSAYKTLILSSEQWQEIFQDKDKWGQAVAAMERHFGSEKTNKALDLLLNRRPETKGKKKGK